MKTELVKADTLIPYARNPRKNSAAVDKIAASIKEFGWQQPIVVDKENVIIAGHTRLLAAQKLGIEDVPVHIADLSETQAKAYRLADNRLSEDADWDIEMLGLEIRELDDLGFELDLTGFDNTELANLLIDPDLGETDEDAVPEPPEEPISKPGDLWILGEHRVLCGDSTNIDDVERLMDGEQADMVFTDPPYGMSYGGGRAAGSTPKGAKVKAHGMIINDDLTGENLTNLIKDSIASCNAVSKSGAAFYICFTWRTYSEFDNALNEIGIKTKACIVWDKKSIGLGLSDYRPQHEFIFYCGGHWYGNKKESDVWYMSRGSTGEYVHPTQKPVELIERALNNSSKGGDVVLDLFGGSGSTLIACQKNGRKARLMELDPKYCDVIVKRWEDFTGEKATLWQKEAA
jgi:DNA modification methylase